MSDYLLSSEEQIEAVLCERLEAIRLRRNITQADLAAEAGVSPRTIRRMAKGEGISLATFIRVLKALKLEGRLEALLPKEDIQPIERVIKPMHVRERATGKRNKSSSPAEPWTWGDE